MTKEVKVPEGVTIETPEPEKKNSDSHSERPADIRRNFEVDPNLPQIVFPHYINNKKDMLSCLLMRPDGSCYKEDQIPKDTNHPVYRDIQRQFSEWELMVNTDRQIHIMDAGKKNAEALDKDMAQKKQRADLWEAKQEFLKLPCMNLPENKAFKREVRKSQTVIGATAFAIAAILKEHENE